ncbi:MAG: hypothetical protein RR531_04060 [Longicatena sp.]
MKKLVSLMAVAMVFTLVGCKDAYVDVSKSDDTLVTVGDQKITKGEVFDIIKTTYGASYTLNEALNIVVDKEKIALTDEMKKTADEQLATLKSSGGDDFTQRLKDNGYESEDDYKEKEIYPNLRQQGLVRKYVESKQKALFKTYSPRKAAIIEAESKEKAQSALDAVKGGKSMSEAASEFGVTTTYKGEEAIYTSKSSLPTVVFDKLKAAEKAELVSAIVEDTTNQKYYVVNITNIDPTSFKEEAIDAIVTTGSTDLSTSASIFYLKKYDFQVYDKDVYDGLKSVNEEYVAD